MVAGPGNCRSAVALSLPSRKGIFLARVARLGAAIDRKLNTGIYSAQILEPKNGWFCVQSKGAFHSRRRSTPARGEIPALSLPREGMRRLLGWQGSRKPFCCGEGSHKAFSAACELDLC